MDAPSTPTVQVPEPFLGGADPAPILPEQPERPEPTGPQHSARSLRLAHEFGYAQADIDNMTPAQLDASVEQMNLFVLRQARENEKRMQAMQNRDRAPAPRPVTQQQPKDELLDESEFDPRLAKTVNRLIAENKQLRQQQGQIVENERRKHVSQMDDAIDGGFEALSKTHGHLFGVGPAGTLPKDSPEMRRRIKIIRASGILNSDSPRQIAAKIKDAVADLVPAATAEPAEEASAYGDAVQPRPTPKNGKPRGKNGQFLTDEEARWQEGALAQPRSRTSVQEPDGRDKAVKNVAKLLQERGEYAGSQVGDQTLDELFPDLN